MHNVLSLFKQNINQLFGICIEILNAGRSLQQLSVSMHLLANNGVIQAARISGGKGRPMLALVEMLNHTPREIRPEIETLEKHCANLARIAACSSNVVWVYHQLIASLLSGMSRTSQASIASGPEGLSHLRFTTPEDVVQLTRHPSFIALEGLERDNRTYVATLCQSNLVQLHARLAEALRCLGDTHRTLSGLKTIGLTARYTAFCVASEAAALAESEASFKSLSTEIIQIMDALDTRTRAMKEAIEHGQRVIGLLLKGETCAQ